MNTKTSLFEQIEEAAKRVDKWPSELQIMREKSYEADEYIRERNSTLDKSVYKNTSGGIRKSRSKQTKA